MVVDTVVEPQTLNHAALFLMQCWRAARAGPMSTGHIPVQKSHLVFSQVAAYCHCTWTSDGSVCCLVPLINCMTSDNFSDRKEQIVNA